MVVTCTGDSGSGPTESPVVGDTASCLFPCPRLDEGSGGKAFVMSMGVVASGNSDYAYTKIAVYPQGYGLYDPFVARGLGR